MSYSASTSASMTHATLDTSVSAFYTMPNRAKQGQLNNICAVIMRCAQRYGGDMSLREIAREYEQTHKRTIDVSSVSARVNELIACHRLQRDQGTRPCCVSGKSIHPVSIPPRQGRLF